MKIPAIFSKRFTFFHLYSVWGLVSIIAIFSVYYWHSWATLSVDSLLALAAAGKDITLQNIPSNLDYSVYYIAIFLVAYFVLGTIIAIVIREYLRRSGITVKQEGRKLVIGLPSMWFQLFFLIRANVIVFGDSAGVEITKTEWQIVGISQGNRIICDVSMLPAGKYTIQRIDFRIVDFLDMFSTLFSLESLKKNVFLDTTRSIPLAVDFTPSQKDSQESQFMSDATESYFATREYRSGDQLKRVHWKQTAKTKKMMVRIPEERTIKSEDLNVVINMYVPSKNVVDQSEITGRYLDAVLSLLQGIIKSAQQTVNVYINGGGVQYIKEMNLYNSDKIQETVLSAAIAQSVVTLSGFIASKNLKNMIIFTTSVDLPSLEEPEVFVFKELSLLKGTFKGWLDTVLHNKNGDFQGDSIGEIVRKRNPLAGIKLFMAKQKLLAICKKNELSLPNSWRTLQ